MEIQFEQEKRAQVQTDKTYDDWQVHKYKPHQVIEDVGQNGMVYRVEILRQEHHFTSPTTEIVMQIVNGHHPLFLSLGYRYFEGNKPVTKRKILKTYMTFGDGSKEAKSREVDLSEKFSRRSNQQGSQI